jgi:hypothetical protein
MWTLSSVLLVSGLEVPHFIHCHHMCEDVHAAPHKKLTNHNTRGELLVEVGGGSLWLVGRLWLISFWQLKLKPGSYIVCPSLS